jgi:hypothetical protein
MSLKGNLPGITNPTTLHKRFQEFKLAPTLGFYMRTHHIELYVMAAVETPKRPP